MTNSEIEDIENKNINELKIILANQATRMLHGEKEAKKALDTTVSIFVKKEINSETELPIFKIKKNEVEKGYDLINLVVITKLLKSKSEVRRSIKDKGIKINDIPIQKDNYKISINDFKNSKKIFKLSHGKKNHVIIKIID